jgi:hypothetical protein
MSRSTARAPITVSRAMAASRVVVLADERSATSVSMCLAEDALMGTEGDRKRKGPGA